ncbi:MAG: hypothetical protein O2855_08230 [Planctomycetota bacterium]|nr:hypothetical protein [Planctomycetota bacterium]
MTTSPTTLFGPFTIDTTGRVFRNGERVEPLTLRQAEREVLPKVTAPTRQHKAQVAELAAMEPDLPTFQALHNRAPDDPGLEEPAGVNPLVNHAEKTAAPRQGFKLSGLVAVVFYVAVRSDRQDGLMPSSLTPPNRIECEEFILRDGDVETGWYRLRHENSIWLFHGPSLARHLATYGKLKKLKHRMLNPDES